MDEKSIRGQAKKKKKDNDGPKQEQDYCVDRASSRWMVCVGCVYGVSGEVAYYLYYLFFFLFFSFL